MRTLVLITAVALSGCTGGARKAATAPTYFASGNFARGLEADIAAMERSVPNQWRDFSRLSHRVDGEYGATFAVACAYAARRDPTLFLRRHLADDPAALRCGRNAYGWSGDAYRRVLDAVYRYRLLEAKSPHERKKIQQFITETTRKT